MRYHIEGSIRVDPNFAGASRKLAKAMVANGWTIAQYNAAQLLCYQRARGDSLTAPQLETVARFSALMAAVTAEMFSITSAP